MQELYFKLQCSTQHCLHGLSLSLQTWISRAKNQPDSRAIAHVPGRRGQLRSRLVVRVIIFRALIAKKVKIDLANY